MAWTEERKRKWSEMAKARWAERKAQLAAHAAHTPRGAEGVVERVERELTNRAHAAVDARDNQALGNAMARLATLKDYRDQIHKLIDDEQPQAASSNGSSRLAMVG